MSKEKKQSAKAAVRDIRRRTRRKFSPEEKIRIPMDASVSVSDDLTRLAVTLNDGVAIYDLENFSLIRIIPAPSPHSPAFRPRSN